MSTDHFIDLVYENIQRLSSMYVNVTIVLYFILHIFDLWFDYTVMATAKET